jgi:vancomycin resistance protein YoaR
VTELPFREKAMDRRVGALLLLGLVVFFGGLYVAGYLITGDKVPRGTTVAGVDIGGKSPEAARAALSEGLADRLDEPVTVSADEQRARISPESAGLSVDIEASVEQAGGGRSWSPGRMWDYLAGGEEYDAVVDVDEEKLEKAVARFAEKVDESAREGTIRFTEGTAQPRYPKAGQSLDREAAAEEIAAAYPVATEVVALPVTEVDPDVTRKQVREAMADFANPAMSAPVILELGGRDIVLRPSDYSAALRVKEQNGTLVPKLKRKQLLKAIRPKVDNGALEPEDATVKLVDGSPRVVPGKPGVTFKPKQVTNQFLSVVVQRGKNRTLELDSVKDKPDFTTKDAKKLGIKEVVSSFTTNFPYSEYRNVNLGRAAQLVNGTVLKPGETFSMNGTVGERTKANGFTEGYIIADGVYKEELGGGVSQVATTLFNAAFFAGLEDVEHRPHSFYIDRYPIGREATVVWGALDLKFKNDTPHGILIQSWVDKSTPGSTGSMNVRMWSTKYWDISTDTSDRYNFTKEKTRYLTGKNCVPHEGYGGFDIDVFRYFRRAGNDELVRKEKMHTTYKPSDTVVCREKKQQG